MDHLTLQQMFQRALQSHAAGKLAEAEALYRQILAVQPAEPNVCLNLGNVLKDQGRSQEALAAYENAIRSKPDFAQAFYNSGMLLKNLDRLDEASAFLQSALRLNPDFPEALNTLGAIFLLQGRLSEAELALNRALQLKPNLVEALANLACVLCDTGRSGRALFVSQQALALNPNFAGAHFGHGSALRNLDRLDEAAAAFRQAIRLQPDFASAHNRLAVTLQDLGDLDGASAAFREAMKLKPRAAEYHSNLILLLHHLPGANAADILAEQKKWAAACGPFPLRAHANAKVADRRLRIGYVCGELWDHPVGRNLLAMFRAHDRTAFEISFYSNSPKSDEITSAIQSCADHWHNIFAIPDEAAAELIRAGQIDILADLSQHSGQNRLPLFARKPAPVQMAFAGYPAGTGLATIDYRISDAYLDPPDGDWQYVEKTLRLPGSFWLYNPPIDDLPGPLPALQSGHLTFGCLNRFIKVNDDALRLWARVMTAVPNSRLIVLAGEGSRRKRVQDCLLRQGIGPERVEVISRKPIRDYLLEYRRIDLGLDTFPYNGHMTSLDAAWMGVPVITRVGSIAVARAGWSLLNNLGMPELAAKDEDEFVEIAVKLASDLPRLAELRGSLRQRMLDSSLTDATGFARNIESLYRDAWQKWCAMPAT